MSPEAQKSNTVAIVVALLGVIGTIVASIIGASATIKTEKLRQESALTQIALVSIGVQDRTAQATTTSAISTSIPTNIPTKVSPTTIVPATPSQSTSGETSFYDDFNNAEFDNDFNHYIWEFWHDNLKGVSQENGVLKMQANAFTSLVAREQKGVYLTAPTFYQSKIKLSAGGAATIKLHVDLPNNSYWTTQCGLLVPDIAYCEMGVKEMSESIYVKEKRIDIKNWYIFQITVNPETRRLDYYIDGEKFGSADIPVTNNGAYNFVVGISPLSRNNTLAYFNDVSFGLSK